MPQVNLVLLGAAGHEETLETCRAFAFLAWVTRATKPAPSWVFKPALASERAPGLCVELMEAKAPKFRPKMGLFVLNICENRAAC